MDADVSKLDISHSYNMHTDVSNIDMLDLDISHPGGLHLEISECLDAKRPGAERPGPIFWKVGIGVDPNFEEFWRQKPSSNDPTKSNAIK